MALGSLWSAAKTPGQRKKTTERKPQIVLPRGNSRLIPAISFFFFAHVKQWRGGRADLPRCAFSSCPKDRFPVTMPGKDLPKCPRTSTATLVSLLLVSGGILTPGRYRRE